jgi:hypothetical protein
MPTVAQLLSSPTLTTCKLTHTEEHRTIHRANDIILVWSKGLGWIHGSTNQLHYQMKPPPIYNPEHPRPSRGTSDDPKKGKECHPTMIGSANPNLNAMGVIRFNRCSTNLVHDDLERWRARRWIGGSADPGSATTTASFHLKVPPRHS